jgi:hypothetical protein
LPDCGQAVTEKTWEAWTAYEFSTREVEKYLQAEQDRFGYIALGREDLINKQPYIYARKTLRDGTEVLAAFNRPSDLQVWDTVAWRQASPDEFLIPVSLEELRAQYDGLVRPERDSLPGRYSAIEDAFRLGVRNETDVDQYLRIRKAAFAEFLRGNGLELPRDEQAVLDINRRLSALWVDAENESAAVIERKIAEIGNDGRAANVAWNNTILTPMIQNVFDRLIALDHREVNFRSTESYLKMFSKLRQLPHTFFFRPGDEQRLARALYKERNFLRFFSPLYSETLEEWTMNRRDPPRQKGEEALSNLRIDALRKTVGHVWEYDAGLLKTDWQFLYDPLENIWKTKQADFVLGPPSNLVELTDLICDALEVSTPALTPQMHQWGSVG